MNNAKYMGLDVQQATISVAVLDSAGKLVMEAILFYRTVFSECGKLPNPATEPHSENRIYRASETIHRNPS
jgi:hypothetical protein